MIKNSKRNRCCFIRNFKRFKQIKGCRNLITKNFREELECFKGLLQEKRIGLNIGQTLKNINPRKITKNYR